MAEELKMLFFEAPKKPMNHGGKTGCFFVSLQASSCKSDLVDAVFHSIAEGRWMALQHVGLVSPVA